MTQKFDIVKHFGIKANSIQQYGCGHINHTFLVVDESGKKYILQKINSTIFKDVKRLMDNIEKITDFAQEEIIKKGGNPERESLVIIKTVPEKHSFYRDGEDYWRMYVFIEHAKTYQTVEKPYHFYAAGVAFGKFQKLLANFPASELYETIPNFHNTRLRFNTFVEAVKKDAFGRAAEVREQINFVLEREKYVDIIVDKLASGEIPLRVTHNDTKFNNVMIDDITGEAICVIDLDTAMAGSSVYDFGDAIRFGTNPVAEDEKDLTKVVMSLSLFEEFTKGYLGELKDCLVKSEIDNLAFSSILMTFECGMRFLTDYLQGDVYFATHFDKQNVYRTGTQFKLVKDMENNMPIMEQIVNKYR